MLLRLASGQGRWLAIAGALLVVLLSGCDPYFVPSEPNAIDIDVRLEPRGGAELRAYVRRPEGQLRHLGDTLGSAAFPHAVRNVRIDRNDPGHPYVVVGARGVYQPGVAPVLRWDGRAVRQALLADGLTDGSLSVCAPAVPAQISTDPGGRQEDGCAAWHLTQGSPDPALLIMMRPVSWPRWLQPALLLVAFGATAGAGAALGRQRRRTWRRRLVAAILALAVLPAAGALAWFANRDDLGVAGRVTGVEVRVQQFASLPGLLLVVVATVVLLIALLGSGEPGSKPTTTPGW